MFKCEHSFALSSSHPPYLVCNKCYSLYHYDGAKEPTEQVYNEAKNKSILKWIKDGHACLEIGTTLTGLKDHFSDHQIIEPTRFEELPAEYFDTVLGIDIFEHMEDSEAFLTSILKVLKPTGQLILMLPFNNSPERMYQAGYIWLYSKRWMKNTLESLFEIVMFDQWLPGHEIIIAEEKRT